MNLSVICFIILHREESTIARGIDSVIHLKNSNAHLSNHLGFNVKVGPNGHLICMDEIKDTESIKPQSQMVRDYTRAALNSIFSRQKNFIKNKNERFLLLIRQNPLKVQALNLLTFGLYAHFWSSRTCFYLQQTTNKPFSLENLWISAKLQTKLEYIYQSIGHIQKANKKTISPYNKKKSFFSIYYLQKSINKL